MGMACDNSTCLQGVCVAASVACAGDSNCVQVGPGAGCGGNCDTSPVAPAIAICGLDSVNVDCASGCQTMSLAPSCGATCVSYSEGQNMCQNCAIAACVSACSNCSDMCDYGCQDVAHLQAYTELNAIADKISSVDGVALINLITEEIARRDSTLTAMTSAAVGTKVMNSTMTAARTNLSRMSKTVSATSAGTKATKTLFQAYVDAARALYETMLYR